MNWDEKADEGAIKHYSDWCPDGTLEAHRRGARWQREQIKKLLANHPDPRCDEHPGNDPISCGWKRAYTDLLNYMED